MDDHRQLDRSREDLVRLAVEKLDVLITRIWNLKFTGVDRLEYRR
jgi:hypothetical protein